MYGLLAVLIVICITIALFFIKRRAINKRRAPAVTVQTIGEQTAQKAWLFASRWGFSLGEADDIYEHFCEDTGESSFAAFS